MATITIKINQKSFQIACDDGQEALVEKAASEVTKKFDHLKSLSPTATTEYLLLLCTLSMQNELLNVHQSAKKEATIDHAMIENSLGEISSLIESLNNKLRKE